jgi:hypothetical protein
VLTKIPLRDQGGNGQREFVFPQVGRVTRERTDIFRHQKSPGSEVSYRSPRESASWPGSGQRRCGLRGAEGSSRRNPTAVAVPATGCRFRCGWWPRGIVRARSRRRSRVCR